LDWGPIDCPLEDRVVWIENHSPSDVGWDWLAESVLKFRHAAASAKNPIVWIAPRSANELSGFYSYLDQIRPDNIRMRIADFPVTGAWRDEPPFTLGELSVERLAEVFDHPSEPWDSDRFPQQRWSTLVREGALLRVVSDGKLQSAPSDFFDEMILQRTPSAWTRWYRIVGDAMGSAWEAGHSVDDSMLKWRLSQLVSQGLLELDGDLSLHGVDQAAKLRRA